MMFIHYFSNLIKANNAEINQWKFQYLVVLPPEEKHVWNIDFEVI